LCINKFNVPVSNITLLTDVTPLKPTVGQLCASLRQYAKVCQPGDSFFWAYSGHGGQQRDTNGDELDGKDECLYGYGDLAPLLDDVIYDILRTFKKGVNIFSLIDACHSGTVLDTPHNLYCPDRSHLISKSMKSLNKHQTRALARKARLATEDVYRESKIKLRRSKSRQGLTPSGSAAELDHKKFKYFSGTSRDTRPPLQATIFGFQGCIDSETSLDVVATDGRPAGALTQAVHLFWKNNNYQTKFMAGEALRAITMDLGKRHYDTQHPTICSTEMLGPETEVVMFAD